MTRAPTSRMAAGEQMREHNRWDLELLDWVRQRFARDLAAAPRL